MEDKITIKDLDEIDNKILFALIEKDRLPQEVLKIAYPEVNKLIKNKIKLEEIYRKYSQYLSRRGKGHLWKLKKLELIQEREKNTSKTEPYKINNCGVILAMLEKIVMLDLIIEKERFDRGDFNLIQIDKKVLIKRFNALKKKFPFLKRDAWLKINLQSKKTVQKMASASYGNKIVDLHRRGFKKDVFVEELAKQMKIKDTDLIFSFMKAKKSFYNFSDFIDDFILFLGQWDENNFLTKIIYQYIDDYTNKKDLAKLIGKKFCFLIDFQKRCHQYYLKKYKSPMVAFDIYLFPREY